MTEQLGNPPPMITLDIPKDPEWLAAVGAVALRHAQLDHILRMTVKSVTGISVAEAWDALARVQSGELRRRVSKLARARIGDGAPLLKLQALLERCERATRRRNDLMHNICASELDGEYKLKTDDHRWRDLPPAEQLGALATEIAELTRELNEARLDGGYLHEALEKNSK